MFRNVNLSDHLLEIVNPNTSVFSDKGENWFELVFRIGLFSLLCFLAAVLHRIFKAEDLEEEIGQLLSELRRIFESTLITRLCLLTAAIVIPLIFFVNTKEHYWTAKHTSMLFTGFLGLCGWLAVCQRVPRFKIPYAWPVALILLSATLSTLRAVNMAEGIGYLFAIFGSAVFMYLASQVLNTSKRIHLFTVTLCLVGFVMSLYGLSQSYLLLPSEHIYAMETRAPVSTIGNKNYAAYFLDLVMPLALALAICRRGPKQTLFGLTVFFFCRWHFALCDTRGGTISMTIGILITIFLVGLYHGRRFRLLLYAVLLEPLLWAGMSLAKLTYSDVQNWGQILLKGEAYKPNISVSLRNSLAPEHANVLSFIHQYFVKANEVALGLDTRVFAMVFGVLLAIGLFLLILRLRDDWASHLGAAAVVAILPFLFATWNMEQNLTSNAYASEVMKAIRSDKELTKHMDSSNVQVLIQLTSTYVKPLIEGAKNFNEQILAKQQNVAAMASLSLFVAMAVFLLFRWYDKNSGWLPGVVTTLAIGGWFLVFSNLCSVETPFIPNESVRAEVEEKLKAEAERETTFVEDLGETMVRLDKAWPVELTPFHDHHPTVGLILTVTSFVGMSLISLLLVIFAMQWIPAHVTREQALAAASRGIFVAKIAVPVLIVIMGIVVWNHPRIERVRTAMWEATQEDDLVAGAFAGAHKFFNTDAKVEGQVKDGAIGFRLEIYQACFRKIKRGNFLLGIGPGNFKVVHPHPDFETALERRILGKEVLGRKAHNDFLEDAVENGVFGFLGLVWMFSTAIYLLVLTLRRIHPPRDASDVFVNTISWGLAWGTVGILVHAQFEAPLLQPASTYPCWMLFGVIFQLYRIQKLRTQRAMAGAPSGAAALAFSGGGIGPHGLKPSAASYELPKSKPFLPGIGQFTKPQFTWPAVILVVTLMTGPVLMRQFIGEMWLRWGMIFSGGGIERYSDVFECMEKAQEVYPQQMETNYILGRYCIDATQKILPIWGELNGPGQLSEAKRAELDQRVAALKAQYQLDVDDMIELAELGIDVHKRDLYMNPNYKWAHNNMGVLCDRLSKVYDILASAEKDPTEKAGYLQQARYYEEESENCYRKALEIDDLQVYALFNLGMGAYHNMDIGRALLFFEKTLLADPGKGEVNLYIAKCRFALENLKGAVEACEDMFEWEARHPKNVMTAADRKELEDLLFRITRYALQTDDHAVSRSAAAVLVERVDRCEYLPTLARTEADLGHAELALQLADEANTQCGKETLSADSVYAQAKANCLLGNKEVGLELTTQILASNAGKVYAESIQNDSAFAILKDEEAFIQLLPQEEEKAASPAAASKTESATQPSEATSTEGN